MQIEAQRGRLPARLLQRLAAHDREAHPGHALQALVGGGHHRVERHPAGVQGQRPERAHGVDEQPPAAPRHHRRDLLHRIQHAGRGLAVHHHHVRDGGIRGERAVEGRRVHGSVLRGLLRQAGAPVVLADPHHAAAVGAVDQHQQLAGRGHQGADHGLHDEGPAALQRDAHVAAVARDHLQQPTAHPAVHGDEVAVARAPVAEHRLLGGRGGGQRAGGQEKRLAARPVHWRSIPFRAVGPLSP